MSPTPSDGADPRRGRVPQRHVRLRHGGGAAQRHRSTCPPGTSVAVVGATGAGKSTLVNLIPRLFDVTGGAVLVDGVDVRQHSLSVLRQSIGYVPQETFLFSMPLRTNVGFGHTPRPVGGGPARGGDISQLNADVSTFPEQYDTIIGERGVTLSGGQKQRTALARAIAKEPRILILDDSFSAVDTHTEAQILHGLARVRRGRTTVLVSAPRSRPSRTPTRSSCWPRTDRRARHARRSCIAQRGLYARMYRRQQLEERGHATRCGEVSVAGAVHRAATLRRPPRTSHRQGLRRAPRAPPGPLPQAVPRWVVALGGLLLLTITAVAPAILIKLVIDTAITPAVNGHDQLDEGITHARRTGRHSSSSSSCARGAVRYGQSMLVTSSASRPCATCACSCSRTSSSCRCRSSTEPRRPADDPPRRTTSTRSPTWSRRASWPCSATSCCSAARRVLLSSSTRGWRS